MAAFDYKTMLVIVLVCSSLTVIVGMLYEYISEQCRNDVIDNCEQVVDPSLKFVAVVSYIRQYYKFVLLV